MHKPIVRLMLATLFGATVFGSCASSIDEIAGCYSVVFLENVNWPLMPPGTIELRTELGTNILERGNYLARTPKGEPGAGFKRAWWRPAYGGRISDGTEYRVLKNFPSEAELNRSLGAAATSFCFHELEYYWYATYRVHKEA